MKIRITGMDGRIYTVTAQEIITWYVRICFIISPAAWIWLWERFGWVVIEWYKGGNV